MAVIILEKRVIALIIAVKPGRVISSLSIESLIVSERCAVAGERPHCNVPACCRVGMGAVAGIIFNERADAVVYKNTVLTDVFQIVAANNDISSGLPVCRTILIAAAVCAVYNNTVRLAVINFIVFNEYAFDKTVINGTRHLDAGHTALSGIQPRAVGRAVNGTSAYLYALGIVSLVLDDADTVHTIR